MGMIGYLLRVKPSELDAILNNSALLEEKIATAITDQSAELSDLDKSWEAIYFLLTGNGISAIGEAEPPLAWTLFSGQEIDPEQDLGYGPGFYTTVEQVKQVDADWGSAFRKSSRSPTPIIFTQQLRKRLAFSAALRSSLHS